jgi:hypothetical protein
MASIAKISVGHPKYCIIKMDSRSVTRMRCPKMSHICHELSTCTNSPILEVATIGLWHAANTHRSVKSIDNY